MSFYYFADQIESSNELNKLVVNNQVDYFKALHGEKALQIIKINNAHIQQLPAPRRTDAGPQRPRNQWHLGLGETGVARFPSMGAARTTRTPSRSPGSARQAHLFRVGVGWTGV